jgi:hypothetical protein
MLLNQMGYVSSYPLYSMLSISIKLISYTTTHVSDLIHNLYQWSS